MKTSFLQKVAGISLSGLVAGALVIGYLQLSPPQEKSLPSGSTPVAQQHPIEDLYSPPAHAAPSTTGTSEQQIINLYKNLSPSVVNVTTRSFQYNNYMELVPQEGAGSGFVIDTAGHVVTNHHVVKGAQRFYVSFGTAEHSYPAQLVGFDERNDLAVLKVQAPKEMLRPVQLGNSSALQVGQTAIAIGNPFALGQTITTGVISSLHRNIQIEQNRQMTDLIQTDAAINSGNSGGPLFDSSGRVIGVNTLILSPSGGSIGLGFAIPINTVKRFVPELIKYGRVQYPWMGVSVLPLNPRIAQLMKLNVSSGLLVMQTLPGGAAANGGIKGGNQRVYFGNYELFIGGDIIVAIDGRPIKTERDLSDYLEGQKRVGDQIKVTVLRRGAGQPVDLNLTLTARSN
jgi:S1-C subfamily serine protease